MTYSQFNYAEVETISVERGLSQSTVFSVLQDERGRLWIATAEGLNIYDGYEINVLKNSDPRYTEYLANSVTSLAQDTLGNIYIGSAERLSVMNIRSHSLKSFIFPETGSKVHRGSIDYMFIDKAGTLWACGNDNLYFIDLSAFRKNPLTPLSICKTVPPGAYSSVSQLLDGTICAVGNTTYFLDPFSKKTVPYIRHEQTKRLLERPTTLLELSPGDFLLPVSNFEIYRYNSKTNVLAKANNFLLHGKEVSLVSDCVRFNDSLIVIGTWRAGIFFYNQNNGNVVEANCNAELGFPPITQMIKDRDDNIWIGCAGGGGLKKVHFINKKFHKVTNPQIAPYLGDGQFIKAIGELEDGRLLLGFFNAGLIIYDRKTGISKTLNTAKSGGTQIKFQDVFAIYKMTSETYYIGTSQGVLKFNAKKSTLEVIPGRFSNAPLNIWHFGAVNGIVYAGSAIGLFSVSDSLRLVTSFDPMNSGINTNSVAVVYPVSANELYLGTHWQGVLKYDTKTGLLDDSLWKVVVKAYPKVSLYIKTIHRDKAGNFWIAAQNVLVKILKSGEMKFFSEKEGLANSFMYGLLEDEHGNVWVSTNKGISRISKENVIRNYKLDDGLQSLEFNTGAFYKSQSGEFFFGGIGGINHFFPDSVKDITATPRVSVTSCAINNVTVVDSIVSAMIYARLNFPYENNNFAFGVSGMCFNNSKNIFYSFFLEGFDKSWTSPSSDRDIRFTNLNPGEYTLLAKACNEDGIWSEAQTVARFTISPPFWQTVWFISLFSAFLVGMITVIIRAVIEHKYKKSLQKIREEQLVMRERERIARDLHDELGATLTSVSMRVQIMQQTKGSDNMESALNNSIGNAIRKLDEIVWTVNPSNDDMQNLFGYITEYAQEFFENSSINYRFDFPEDMQVVKFSPERRYNIFLIVKEALNNVQKYADADTVIIRANQMKNILTLSVIDNGKGFDMRAVAPNSNGLTNMHKRAEMAEAEIKIQSVPGNGTTVSVQLDLNTIDAKH